VGSFLDGVTVIQDALGAYVFYGPLWLVWQYGMIDECRWGFDNRKRLACISVPEQFEQVARL
jgi:hypothetical protein